MITKLSAVLCLVAASLLAAGASASPVHFAALPLAGVKPSTPTTGTMALSLGLQDAKTGKASADWNVYADGRIIWQKWTPTGDATVVPDETTRLDTAWVQQRVTIQGVQLLQSKLLATGLFEHDLKLELKGRDAFSLRVRTRDRAVSVEAFRPEPYWTDAAEFTTPTPDQVSALAWIEKLVADPARWLPSGAWADRQIRAFVPARYLAEFDRSGPDLSKLPPLAREAFSRYYLGHGCLLSTGHTRALLQAFVDAGISPSGNAESFGFVLPGSAKTPTGKPIPSVSHLSPALPDDRC